MSLRTKDPIRKNPPEYPNHGMTGKIIQPVKGGYEVIWSDRTITYERASELENC